jgi:MFS family permease
MEDMWVRFTSNLIERVSGPLHFRLVLQPLMAAFFAIRSGLADASADKPPYFWGLLSDRTDRRAMLKDGWKSVSRVFVLAVVLDVVYQLYVLHFVYPGEAIVVAVILAIVPYLILRGLVTRAARAMGRGASTHTPPGTHRHA